MRKKVGSISKDGLSVDSVSLSQLVVLKETLLATSYNKTTFSH